MAEPVYHPLAFTACHLLCGGAVLAGLGLAGGDASRRVWSPARLGAIVFLAVFSSTFGFVPYPYLLLQERPSHPHLRLCESAGGRVDRLAAAG